MMSKASWMVMSFTASVTRPPTFFPGTTLKSPCSARNLSTARTSICRRSSEILLESPGRRAGFSGPATCAGCASHGSRSIPVISPATPKLTRALPSLEEIVVRVSIREDDPIPQDGLYPNLVDRLALFEKRGLPLGGVFDHGDGDRAPRDAHQLESLRLLPQDLERCRLRRFRWCRRLRRLHGPRLCFRLLGFGAGTGIEEVPRLDLCQIVFHGPESRQRLLLLGRGPRRCHLHGDVRHAGSDALRIQRDRSRHENQENDEATVDELEVELSGRHPSREPGRDEPNGLVFVRKEERCPRSGVPERESPPARVLRFDEPQEPFLWRHCPEHLDQTKTCLISPRTIAASTSSLSDMTSCSKAS